MISVKCDMCGQVLDTAGGLLFSPPYNPKGPEFVKKKHLCVYCFEKVNDFILVSKSEIKNHD